MPLKYNRSKKKIPRKKGGGRTKSIRSLLSRNPSTATARGKSATARGKSATVLNQSQSISTPKASTAGKSAGKSVGKSAERESIMSRAMSLFSRKPAENTFSLKIPEKTQVALHGGQIYVYEHEYSRIIYDDSGDITQHHNEIRGRDLRLFQAQIIDMEDVRPIQDTINTVWAKEYKEQRGRNFVTVNGYIGMVGYMK